MRRSHSRCIISFVEIEEAKNRRGSKVRVLGATTSTFAPHHHYLYADPPNIPNPHLTLSDLPLNPPSTIDQQ